MAAKAHVKRMIAPRLANGESRIGFGSRLPVEIKEGIRSIAIREGKSMSWVMEEVVIDYFGMRKPRYREAKAKAKKGKRGG